MESETMCNYRHGARSSGTQKRLNLHGQSFSEKLGRRGVERDKQPMPGGMCAALAWGRGHWLDLGDPIVEALVVDAIKLFDQALKAPDRIYIGGEDDYGRPYRGRHRSAGKEAGLVAKRTRLRLPIMTLKWGSGDNGRPAVGLKRPALGDSHTGRVVLGHNLVQRPRRRWPTTRCGATRWPCPAGMPLAE